MLPAARFGHGHSQNAKQETGSLADSHLPVLQQPSAQAAGLTNNVSLTASEIPPQIASEMRSMIADLKNYGQIPMDVDTEEMMMNMHREMMREKASMQQRHTCDGPTNHQPIVSTGYTPPLAPLPAPQQGMTPLMAYLAKPEVDTAGRALCTKHDHYNTQHADEGSDVLAKATIMLARNPDAIVDLAYWAGISDEHGNSMLHHACRSGDESLAALLLNKGMNPDKVNKQQQTAVHVAAGCGQVLILQMLLERGADMKVVDGAGWTAMHHAANSSSPLATHTLHYLNECYGLSYTDLTDDRQSPLHLACQKASNHTMIKFLLRHERINIHLQDALGNTALHYAAQLPAPNICYRIVTLGGVQTLLVSNKRGKTPLALAAQCKSIEGFNLGVEMKRWLEKGQLFKPKDGYPWEYLRQMFGPLLLVLTSYLSALVLLPENQGCLTLMGTVIATYWVMYSGPTLQHLSELPNPARCAGFVGAAVCVGYALGGVVIPSVLLLRPISCLILALCSVVIAFLFFLLVTREPGYCQESKRKESGEFYTMRDLVATFRKPIIWCATCELIPTKPAIHCTVCDRCTRWMDHHSFLTMNCVAHRNLHLYVLFVGLLVIAQCIFLSLIPTYYFIVYPQLPPLGAAVLVFRYEGFMFCVCLFVLVWLPYTARLLLNLLVNAANGYTELIRPKGYHKSGLSWVDMLTNIVYFLATGNVKARDPLFFM